MPVIPTAPGPGRSAEASTSVLKLGGMQKMLTMVDGTAGPPVVMPVAGEPVSTMVRATSRDVKAPEVRWPQLVKLEAAVAPVKAAQSAFAVQETGKHACELGHPLHGTPTLAHGQRGLLAEPLHLSANELSVLFLQNPQKTLL